MTDDAKNCTSGNDKPVRLTLREIEILGLVSEGYRDKEIAERLFISVCTVHNHEAQLRQKLNVHTRTALVREARRLGIIE
ncbi:MAG: LuxR C-terminal-related transcriptional regulator [Armatimonadetes bacterium]|nr:LuxR C-terminal-related transcriptional regulator [Armatimonadota bacterium]